MLISRILRTALAAVYFAMVARSLGASGYGAFTAACALASILSPFASLGTGNLLVRDVSRDANTFARRWGVCLRGTIISGLILTTCVCALGRLVLPRSVPMIVVLAITIAEVFFARILDVAGMAFQAVEQLSMTAAFSFALSFARSVAAALLLLFSTHAAPQVWSLLYLLSTAFPACIAVMIVHHRLGLPAFGASTSFSELREGVFYSVSLSAQTIYNDIDKTMLARMVSLGAAGAYAAAYRVIDAAFSPVNALMYAAYARFFQHGQHGLRRTSQFGLRMFSRAGGYSIVVGAAVWLGAPWVRSVLGAQFEQSVTAVRLLCPLLVLRSAHVFAADSLTGAGYQGTRTALQVLVAAANVLLNLALLPRYSWRGACYSSLLCDGALVVLLWSAVGILRARERVPRDILTPCAAAES